MKYESPRETKHILTKYKENAIDIIFNDVPYKST